MIPGSNLLAQALTVIAPTQCLHWATTGRTLNSIGQWIVTYAEPVNIWASVQAVPRKVYRELGLDFQKSYVQFYSVTLITDLTRDTAGDLLEWNGRRYQLESKNDWKAIDGWAGVVGVDIGEATGVLPTFPLSAPESELIAIGLTGRAELSNEDYDFSWTITDTTNNESYGAALPDFIQQQPIDFPDGQTKCFELGITAPMLFDSGGTPNLLARGFFTVASMSQFLLISIYLISDGTCEIWVNNTQKIADGLTSAPAAIGVSVTSVDGALSAVINMDGMLYNVSSTNIPPIASALGEWLFASGFSPEDIGKTYSIAWRPYASMMTLTYPDGAVDMQDQPI